MKRTGAGRPGVGHAVASAAGGLLAGAVGTLAMDLLWYARARRGGEQPSFLDWETAKGLSGYEHASAPAQAGKKAVTLLTGTPPADSTARAMTNAVHWATGAGWAALYGLVASRELAPRRRLLLAAGFGPAVWASSYLLLGAAGIYQPIWEYDAKTLGQDLSAHVVYGGTTAVTFAALASAAHATPRGARVRGSARWGRRRRGCRGGCRRGA